MSPRAAWRLESLGFREVYEYKPGKADWLAAGLPTEGTGARKPRILQFVARDAPTCRPGEKLADAAARATASGWDMCLVVNEQGILLGRLDQKELRGDGAQPVERAMRPGPSTYRPDVPAAELRHLMAHRGIGKLPVTDGDGRLLGVVCRDALDDLADEVIADEPAEVRV
jgi:predicted transcriptional regulator